MSETPTIFCLMGPTASGKTDLAIDLLKHLPCEIISVDSAMVYREMNIGTSKPSPDILKETPHRLIDICDPSEIYSAGNFRDDALREINNIISYGKIPLLVGGTMLYFHALQNELANLPKAQPEIREKILQEAEKNGWEYLHERLKKIDDPQRLQRALEVYEITGKSLTDLIEESSNQKLPFRFINFALIPNDRNKLNEVIANRFDKMLKQGLIEEVEKLFYRGDLHIDLPSIRAVGYRQVWEYLSGNIDKELMREKAIIATRQLAKRQMTWLRSWKNLITLESQNKNNIERILKDLKS
jgi:tRNA dimethylallyltransferase